MSWLIIGTTVIIVILFWFVSNKIWNNNTDINSDDSSESEDETIMQRSEEKSEHNYSGIQDVLLDTDAINPERKLPISSVGLTIMDVQDIEENLDDYEKVSLIFLLSDKPEDCLDGYRLSEWAEKEKLISRYWEEKLWEALTIIKNFQLPKKYGLLKKDLMEEYFPYNRIVTKHISKFKKTLYFICESFFKENEKLFIQELRKDLVKKNLDLPQFSHMEMYFSYLLKIGYLSEYDTQNCARIFKKLDFEEAQVFLEDISLSLYMKEQRNTDLESLISSYNSNITSDETRQYKTAVSGFNDSTQDNASTSLKDSVDVYRRDGRKICLIINQKNFHTEIDKQYEHLLPPNNDEEKLNARHGTDYDAERLKSVLEKRHFEVFVETNLVHLKTIKVLKNFVDNIDVDTCVCFFVVILSHGDKGVVYCANSCYVKLSTIVDIMSNKKLFKIPKVLILQTCQGPFLQIADENLTTDGDSASNDCDDPKAPNFLIFSSTVPGFASIRDKKKGSWFIQSLCDQIESSADRKHFLDICTKVTDQVGKLHWRKDGKIYYMISYKRDTFMKYLFI